MIKKRRTTGKQKINGLYQSPNVPMSAIRQFARQVIECFQPEKIILFGSYAYGKPHRDSDVDILVVMPCYDEMNQSVRIWEAIDPPFSLDLIVRTPRRLRWRIRQGDWFLREVMERGEILYEKTDPPVGSQGRTSSPGDPLTPGASRTAQTVSIIPLLRRLFSGVASAAGPALSQRPRRQ